MGTDDVQSAEVRRSQIWFFEPSPETEFIFGPLKKAAQMLNQGYQFDISGFGTGCQIARYTADVKGHYDWHIDLGTGRFSQRKLSLSVQLSAADGYDGGDLDFQLRGIDGMQMGQLGTLFDFPWFF